MRIVFALAVLAMAWSGPAFAADELRWEPES